MEFSKKQRKSLEDLFRKEPLVKLVYLFGSRARGDAGPLSDHDFAVYADTQDSQTSFMLKINLQSEISAALGTDAVDVVMLNTTESPELKYNIISEGKLIYEQQPSKVIVEPRILNEYFDLRYFLLKYKLTKAP